jgi:nucleoside-diphosphate-sugar epimerase
LNVLRACEEGGVKKLLHVSSTASLGFGERTIREESSFDWSRCSRCVYAHSKSLPEEAILRSPCDTAILYPALVLGPGDNMNTLPLLQAVKHGMLSLSPPGTNSGIHIRDLARAIAWVIDREVPGRKLILAAYHFSLHELATVIAEMLQVPPPRAVLPRPIGLPIRWLAYCSELLCQEPSLTYEQAFLAFQERLHDTSRMRTMGFEPQYDLRQTISDAATYFLSVGLLV